MIWAPADEPGAVAITALRHPAAPPGVTGIPDPDHDAASATWTT